MASGPLEALEAIARQEVRLTPSLRHLEVFTMRGLLTILWHGDPDASSVVLLGGRARACPIGGAR